MYIYIYINIINYIQYKDAPVPGTMWHTLPEEIIIALITNMHACRELSLSSSGWSDAIGFDLTSDKSDKKQSQLNPLSLLLVLSYFISWLRTSIILVAVPAFEEKTHLPGNGQTFLPEVSNEVVHHDAAWGMVGHTQNSELLVQSNVQFLEVSTPLNLEMHFPHNPLNNPLPYENPRMIS